MTRCRAWTKNPILRTTQALLVTLTLLRLLQCALQAWYGDSGWFHPPWWPKKQRPSVLDVERLLWAHWEEIQQPLSDWLAERGNQGAEEAELVTL